MGPVNGHNPPEPAADVAGPVDITFAALLDARDVNVVFQPVVDLRFGQVVGLQARVQGPEGSPFATPQALFAEARLHGRVAELDWVCRAAAFQAVLDADLPPSMSLFVTIEPESLTTECPPDVAGVVARAESALRVFVELNEQALTAAPAGLLRTVERARQIRWGIALVDIGASRAPLAMMPIVHADVVTLDLRLLNTAEPADVSAIVTSVLHHVEATGGSLLVEGIASEADLQWARALGAAYGRGQHLGPSGPLQDEYSFPRAAVRLLKQELDDVPVASAFPMVAELTHQQVSKDTLGQLVQLLARTPRSTGAWPVVLVCVGRDGELSDAVRARLAELPGELLLLVVFGTGIPSEPAPGMRGIRLRPDDPLADERFLIVLNEQSPVALLGQAVPATRDLLFDVVITQDEHLLHRIARNLIRRMPSPGQPNIALPVPVGDTAAEVDGDESTESEQKHDGWWRRLTR